MRILVISDTHGKIETAQMVYRKMEDVNLIIHLGDLISDARHLEKSLGVEVVAVKGNMDGDYSADGFRILETTWGKLYLAHGHMENVKFSPQTIFYRALENDCRAALFGHTHVPCYEEVNGVYLLNPGSLTFPRGGRPGSYAVLNIEENTFSAGIVYIDKMLEQEKKQANKALSTKRSRREGGYLKNLLNNSDRF